MSGWVRIERDLIVNGHEMLKREPSTEVQALLWVIASAAWDDTKHTVGGQVIDVPRGSFITTVSRLQSAFMWSSAKRVRTFLDRLEKGATIGQAKVGPKGHQKTMLSVCNYDKYQNAGQPKGNQRATKGATKGQTKETINNKTINNNPAGGVFSSLEDRVDYWADIINGEGVVIPSAVNPILARALVASGKVSPEKLREKGIAA